MAITLSLGAALPAGATIAVSSRISLLADADAGNNLVSDSNSVSQGATINPLGPISVDAVSVDGGATARAFATVGSIWTSASAGQVVFSNVGFSSSGVSFGSAGFPFQGLDWEYVFIATDTGEFDLDFSVSIGAGTTDSFGLNPIIFLWSGAGGGDFLRRRHVGQHQPRHRGRYAVLLRPAESVQHWRRPEHASGHLGWHHYLSYSRAVVARAARACPGSHPGFPAPRIIVERG